MIAMQFNYRVTIKVSREEGKFASRAELSEQLAEELEDVGGGGLEGEDGGLYAVDEVTVEEVS